jgi:hypothetical protein
MLLVHYKRTTCIQLFMHRASNSSFVACRAHQDSNSPFVSFVLQFGRIKRRIHVFVRAVGASSVEFVICCIVMHQVSNLRCTHGMQVTLPGGPGIAHTYKAIALVIAQVQSTHFKFVQYTAKYTKTYTSHFSLVGWGYSVRHSCSTSLDLEQYSTPSQNVRNCVGV